jgi:hypothetical protein
LGGGVAEGRPGSVGGDRERLFSGGRFALGLRAGSSPVVLYRDRSGPVDLDLRPNEAGSLLVTAKGSRVLSRLLSMKRL